MASLFVVSGTRKWWLLETNFPKFRSFWYSQSRKTCWLSSLGHGTLLERQHRSSSAQRLKNAFDVVLKTTVLDFAKITKKRMARHARTQLHLLFSQLGCFFSNSHGHHYEMSEPNLQGESPNSERLGRTSCMASGGRTPFLFGNQKHLFHIRHILHQRDLGMLLTCRSRLHFFTNFWAFTPILIWLKMTKECLLEDRLVKTLSLCNAP